MATALRSASRSFHRSDIIETLAYRAYQLADDCRTPARSVIEFERRAHEAECIASQLRAEFRGRQEG